MKIDSGNKSREKLLFGKVFRFRIYSSSRRAWDKSRSNALPVPWRKNCTARMIRENPVRNFSFPIALWEFSFVVQLFSRFHHEKSESFSPRSDDDDGATFNFFTLEL